MEDLRITRLVVNNVGVFEHLDLTFKKKQPSDKAEVHIFTGENGTGKTTILEALTYFDFQFNELLEEQKKNQNKNYQKYQEGLLNKKQRQIERPERNNEDDFEFEMMRMKMRKSRRSEEEKYAVEIHFFKKEIQFWNGGGFNNETYSGFFKDYYNKNFYQSDHRYNFFAYNGHRQLKDTKVEAFKNFEFNPITEALSFEKKNVNLNLFQWIANNKTRAALSFQKGNKKESDRYLQSIQKIETAIGEIIGRRIEFFIDEDSLNVMIKLDNESLHYNTLADGYKSVISWLTDLIFRLDYMPREGQENFTLFLDEIDIHLHPAAQRRILPVIQKLFPKAQIFLTTHSPFVIGSVDGAWVYKFKLDEKGNSVLDGEPFLTEDAKSYRYILEQVFDINKQFGIEIEKRLDEFYKIRDEIIKNSTGISSKGPSVQALTKIGKELAVQSEELRAIIGSEIKQLSRILKKEITI